MIRSGDPSVDIAGWGQCDRRELGECANTTGVAIADGDSAPLAIPRPSEATNPV